MVQCDCFRLLKRVLVFDPVGRWWGDRAKILLLSGLVAGETDWKGYSQRNDRE